MKILLIAVFTLISISVKPQSFQTLNDTNVVFVDYSPDIVLANNNDTLCIDINQDGNLDVKFYYVIYSGGRYPYFKNLNSNWKYSAFATTNGDSLNGSTIVWHYGDWFWYNDIMFGLKYDLGGDFYYGWIHAGSFPETMIIDKYAFCKIPNYPFHLGQTEITTSVPNINAPDSTNVYLTNSGNNLHVQSGKLIKSVTITSANGVVVIFQDNLNSVSANINIGGIAHGVYIVQVRFEDLSVYNKQIVK